MMSAFIAHGSINLNAQGMMGGGGGGGAVKIESHNN